jgi:hypothetical protein
MTNRQQETCMVVRHFGGIERLDKASVARIFAERFGDGFNEYSFFDEHLEYPRLTVLANRELAAVYYFPEEGHPGYVSVGNDDRRDSGDLQAFRASTPGEEIFVPVEAVVPVSVARTATEQFFISSSHLPSALEWREL